MRLEGHSEVAFLRYAKFFEDPFPSLEQSWKVDLRVQKVTFRNFRNSLNPPILHRKELLLADDHPGIEHFKALTENLERLGLFECTNRIGFRIHWSALLQSRGFRLAGHDLVPVGNVEALPHTEGPPFPPQGTGVQRHLTALHRESFSAPISVLLKLGLIQPSTSVFDYGCGHGTDVAGLKAAGFVASGWDPYYARDNPRIHADFVNLGFVLNVIEEVSERAAVLKQAFGLANVALVVSAMIASDDRCSGSSFADGIITGWNTFQKYYTQTELREYLEDCLRTEACALAPGVFILFKEKSASESFHMGRARRRVRVTNPKIRTRLPATKKPVGPARKCPGENCREDFAALCALWEELGREPAPSEVTSQEELRTAFGTLKRSFAAARAKIRGEYVDAAKASRTEDVLVYLALQKFRRQPPDAILDIRLKADVKAFWGTQAAATRQASELLLRAGNASLIAEACIEAYEAGLGWLTDENALLLHSSLVDQLPSILRVYIGCAGILFGGLEIADVVKVHSRSGKVTLLRCNDFTAALPKVIERTKVNLRTQSVQFFTYSTESGFAPESIYAKSRLMHQDFDAYAKQLEFDRALLQVIRVDDNCRGPSDAELAVALAKNGFTLENGSLVATKGLPALDQPCGKHFCYRDLILCGDTPQRLGAMNVPKMKESYRALVELAENVLDPVIDWFGSIELTYGFCAPEVAREITKNVAPSLDQHSASELSANGSPLCARRGAAVDFLVRDENMFEVARWIANNTPFDRLYYYGPARPVHVSYGPEHKRACFEMLASPIHQRRIPKRLHFS